MSQGGVWRAHCLAWLRELSGYPVTAAPGAYTWHIAIELADHALYAVKGAGRNCGITYLIDNVSASEWSHHIDAIDITRWIAGGYASDYRLETGANPG